MKKAVTMNNMENFIKNVPVFFFSLALLFVAGETYAESADSYFDAGGEYFRQGKYVEAERAYSQAINLDNHVSDYFKNRGIVNIKLKRYSQAVEDLTTALKLPNSVGNLDPLNNGIVGIFWKGMSEESFKTNAGYYYFSDVYKARAEAYCELKDFEREISDLNKAIELNDKNSGAYFNRGGAYGNKDMFDQAFSDFTQAIAIDSKYANAYFFRAFFIMKKAISIGIVPNEGKIIINDLEQYLLLEPKGEYVAAARSYINQMKQNGY
jgi:tetratricopeptide (TPR) repeat protein